MYSFNGAPSFRFVKTSPTFTIAPKTPATAPAMRDNATLRKKSATWKTVAST